MTVNLLIERFEMSVYYYYYTLLCRCNNGVAMLSGDDGEQKGIPGFWLKIFKNMDILSPMIRVCTLYLLFITVLNVPVSILLMLWCAFIIMIMILELKGSVKEPNLSIYFFLPPITQWCSVSDVLFTGGREVSDFNV